MFHGSYRPADVEFLLKPIQMEFIADLQHKEALIQTGQRHYSEMLSPERVPSDQYFSFFRKAHMANRKQLAQDCLQLAQLLHDHHGPNVTIVSLARAGTPIGAISRHLVERLYRGQATHYSVSIIRDRGIDTVALREILARGHDPESIAFVDGWTGKGVISRELEMTISQFNEEMGTTIDSGLNVLTDLAGSAARTASGEDYLIASSILNSTISGLVSRSILNDSIGPEDYHGCVYFEEFTPYDLSRWFVDDVVSAAMEIHERTGFNHRSVPTKLQLGAISRDYMVYALSRYGISDVNLIKPGIGEATRVLLRRNPERVIVRDSACDRVAHLVALATEKNVRIDVDQGLPYHAVSIIRSALDA
ncbi:MAG: cysteine protease StiP family protein [Sulfuricellaceae bacterium]|nr:cysteine protease StiP family protein [Sulfuricellaceae bacterium]